MHTCNPSTRETETKESQVGGQPKLLSETLSQKTQKQANKQTIDHFFMMKTFKIFFFLVYN
jgi:hypothetical protein